MKKQDSINITILVVVALAISVYLVATTVLVSKDSGLYIKMAQKMAGQLDKPETVRIAMPGYPVLIFLAHKISTIFSGDSSIYRWIYSAQAVCVLCRLLTLVPLYFLGKIFVGQRNSFWAILIFIFLPYPARIGSDALKDGPYLMFLVLGFWMLVWGAARGRVWAFGIAGLASAFGHMVRPECTQILAYGVLWLLLNLFYVKSTLSNQQVLHALALLLISFAVVAVPYWAAGYEATPPQVDEFISQYLSFNSDAGQIGEQPTATNDQYTVKLASYGFFAGLGKLIGEVSENLLYVFVAPLILGFYDHFRRKITPEERFFIPAFIFLNVAMLMLLYDIRGYVSRRHCLALVALTVFYIPGGFTVIANWCASKFSDSDHKAQVSLARKQGWFLLLILISLCFCLPKLLRPMRIEKRGYRIVAKWLAENTDPMDLIAVPDHRIGFYAGRQVVEAYKDKNAAEIDYIVTIVKRRERRPTFDKPFLKEAWTWVDKRKKREKLVIYRIIK